MTDLESLPTDTPNVALDMEVSNLGHNSWLQYLQIASYSENKFYLVDLLVLQKDAFDTPGAKGMTLRQLFEDSIRQKLVYDVRGGPSCLYG